VAWRIEKNRGYAGLFHEKYAPYYALSFREVGNKLSTYINIADGQDRKEICECIPLINFLGHPDILPVAKTI
jgi:hypothetical protein